MGKREFSYLTSSSLSNKSRRIPLRRAIMLQTQTLDVRMRRRTVLPRIVLNLANSHGRHDLISLFSFFLDLSLLVLQWKNKTIPASFPLVSNLSVFLAFPLISASSLPRGPEDAIRGEEERLMLELAATLSFPQKLANFARGSLEMRQRRENKIKKSPKP